MPAEVTTDEKPDITVSVRQTFGLDVDMQVPAFSQATEHVPAIDDTYRFDRETTLAILAGFAHNRRVMIQGYHGTGKSTHIEQVRRPAQLAVHPGQPGQPHQPGSTWSGKDAIVLRDGVQVTEYREGILPWALQHPCALVFDEYDAGRPDVMFVIQRVLEVEGKMTLLDQNKVIRPHPAFRLFATANTIGLGDTTGLYHGTQQINQGQMDRWNIVATLNYLPHDEEVQIVLSKLAVLRHGRRAGADQRHGAGRRPVPRRLHQRRHLDRHVAAHGDHLGGERPDLRRRHPLRLPDHLPQQVRRDRAAGGRRVLPARLRHRAAGDRRQRPWWSDAGDCPAPRRAVFGVSMSHDESPVETFKRATSSVLRAMAEREDVTVTYSGEAGWSERYPGAAAAAVTLAHLAGDHPGPRGGGGGGRRGRGRPSPAPPRRQAARQAACPRANWPVRPSRRWSRPACEAIGARQMAGVAANLSAALDERYRRQGFDRITDREQAPLAEVMRLLARESLTGEPPPACAPPGGRAVAPLGRGEDRP